jgi:tetratricopeptide (TPR) repeat protein
MHRLARVAAILLLPAVAFLSSCTGGADRQAGDTEGRDSVQSGIEQLTQQIREDQDDPELYDRRARLFLYKRQFDQALQDVQKAISISDDRPGPYVTLSDIYLLMGRPDDSRESLLKALTKDPENTLALLRLGKLYLSVRD